MSDQFQLRRDTLANIAGGDAGTGRARLRDRHRSAVCRRRRDERGFPRGPSIPFFGYKSGRYLHQRLDKHDKLHRRGQHALRRAVLRADPGHLHQAQPLCDVRRRGKCADRPLYQRADRVAPGSLVAGTDSGSFSTAARGARSHRPVDDADSGMLLVGGDVQRRSRRYRSNGLGVFLPVSSVWHR